MINEDPDGPIKRLLEQSPIVLILREYGLEVEESGSQYRLRCPFHPTGPPSFIANSRQNTWRCTACGESGNPIQFVRIFENISYFDAVRRLAKRAGTKLDDDGESEGPDFAT